MSRVVDFWWESETEPAPALDVRKSLIEIKRLRPAATRPVLVICGRLARFQASVLSKSAQHTGLFTAISLKDATRDLLLRPSTAVIKWSPHSEYSISDRERAFVPSSVKIINDTHFQCAKENIVEVFEHVSGRSSRVDPLRFSGTGITKSSRNGAHDAALMRFPVAISEPERVYEKLVDNSIAEHFVYDIRVPFIFGVAPLAYVKFRPRVRRFENVSSFVKLLSPIDVLAPHEIELCRTFCQQVGLEYGELDVLRDGKSQEIYIVDANNTPAGPPKGISQDERMMALSLIATTFVRHAFGSPL